jgi:putative Holliday junction resolvase
MAFDYGTTSIGSAIGQPITGTASPLKAFRAKDGIPDWNEIGNMIQAWQPDLLIVGLPMDLHGQDLTNITQRARKFANRLHGRFGLPVQLHDERLSSTEARATLFDQGGFKALKKGNIDCQSAVVILESWFEINRDTGGK